MGRDYRAEQRAPGVRWPDRATMALWREHGGDQHGPHAETVTMPMHLLPGFLDAYSAAALAAARREIEGLREALEPFAEACSAYRWPDHDDAAPIDADSGVALRLRDLRRAARALGSRA